MPWRSANGNRTLAHPSNTNDPLADLRDQLQSTLGTHYTLERELGGGGMSRVFVALESALNRRVVVKVLPHEMAASVSVDRFKREIALAARLQHPHIVPLLSAGETGGLPYFTMPLIEGESLRARLARGGELPVNEGLRLLREVASALDYAHEKGVIHRDIKPDNVLLSRGSAMVSDFGVAKALSASSNAENSGMTSLGVALGTPAYMSPEQAAASPNIDARADVYAFGIMAYELFAGRPPFAGRSPQAMLAAHVSEAPEQILKLRPALPVALASLIMRCLEKHPADRPQSAADIVHALDSINTPSGGMQPTGMTPAHVSGSPLGGVTPTPTAGTTSRWPRVVVGSVAAAFAIAVVLYVVLKGRLPRAATDSAKTATAAAAKSIAVVPFTGSDTKDEYFADGVADELTTMLARLPALGVAARSSAFSFKGKPVSSRQIGESLHVATVVEGTVRRSETRLRITASLINVVNGLTLWSDAYDVDPKDVFTVQEQIARKIAGQLQVTLGAATSRNAAINVEAHDLYLQGQFHAARLTEPEQRIALSLFEKALAIDSTYAAAWAGVADAWATLADDWAAPKEAYPKSKAAAERALALDSLSAEAHEAIASASLWWDFDIPAALAHGERALQLQPSYETALFVYASTLSYVPRLADSALAVFRAAERLDPHNAVMAAHICGGMIGGNDGAAATEAECKRALDLDPGAPDAAFALGDFYRYQKRYEEALKTYGRGVANPDRLRTRQAHTYIEMGKPDEARRLAADLEETAKHRYVRGDAVARLYDHLGDKEKTVYWLRRAFDERSASLVGTDFGAWRFKDDPRIQAIAAKIEASIKRPK